MHVRQLAVGLILLLHACGPLLAQTLEPVQPDSLGLLQRLAEKAREAKAKVQDLGGAVLGFAGAYYEEHIHPVTGRYTDWASSVKNSVWEKIQTAIDKSKTSEAD